MRLSGQFGNGIAFFPSQEPDFMQVQIRARDNTSIYERDRLVRLVENRLLGYDEVASLYARSVSGTGRGDDETIGTLRTSQSDGAPRSAAVSASQYFGVRMASRRFGIWSRSWCCAK